MTDDEANTVLAIMSTADGGCYVCVGDLVEDFLAAFPDKLAVVRNHDDHHVSQVAEYWEPHP